MCGIAGIWQLDPGDRVPADLLAGIAARLRHRGPDDEGYLLVDTRAGVCEPRRGADTVAPIAAPDLREPGAVAFDLGLCFRRLSIIDLSPAGHQPMGSADGSAWIIFNGEIYNYVELREELRARGHVFRTATDTEVILAAYQEWGERCLERFNGMWAFALYDGRRRRLFCARDRFGVKPFHYVVAPGRFAFASEIKALLPVLPAPAAPNADYLAYFLSGGDLADGEETLVEGVRSLLPGHYMLVENGRVRTVPYWDLAGEVTKQAVPAGDEAAAEALRALLADSVRLRLRSDVPVGTCLSGGLDSSSIVGLAQGMLPHAVKTFSALYADADCNEEPFVRAAVQRFGADSFETWPDGRDLPNILPRLVWHMDGPTGSPGIYTQWHVMKLAHGQVTVLLDGQGGDELVAGYFRHFAPYLHDRTLRRIALARLPGDLAAISRLTGVPGWRLMARAFRPWISRFRHGQIEREMPSLHPEFRARADGRRIARPHPDRLPGALNSTLYWDLVQRSIPQLLHYEDRNSMAFSIEARVPFLDYRLVAFCLALPPEQKIRGATTKYVLRRAMGDVLPPAIVERRDKKGYPTPVARWFRADLAEYVRAVLLDPRARERRILDPSVVAATVADHQAGRVRRDSTIWRWLTAELWLRQAIDAPGGAQP